MKKTVFVLVVIVLILGGLVIWQRDNLASLVSSIIYSDEEITQKLTQSKAKVQQALDFYTDGSLRDFTVEEEERIRKGEVSPQQAWSQISPNNATKETDPDSTLESAQAPLAQAGQTETGSINPGKTPEPSQQSADITNIIKTHVSEIYLLKAQYISKLGEFERRVLSEWKSLPKEKRTQANKQALIAKYIGELASMERSCDLQVDAILSSLESQLKAVGGDLSIINTIKNAYTEEKNLQKAYFISTYR